MPRESMLPKMAGSWQTISRISAPRRRRTRAALTPRFQQSSLNSAEFRGRNSGSRNLSFGTAGDTFAAFSHQRRTMRIIRLAALLILGITATTSAQQITPDLYRNLTWRTIGPEGNRFTSAI